MSAIRKPRTYTDAEYLAVEEKADRRSELHDGVMYAMAGAGWPHTFLVSNLVRHLGNAFGGGPCRTMSHDMRVKVDRTGKYYYPDVLVVCGPLELTDGRTDTIVNPKVVIEVLSPSTERFDRGLKFRNYQLLSSLAEYVLVAQDEPVAERYVRQPDGAWARVDFVGLAATLELATVPAAVPLNDVYDGVTFPPAADPDTPPGCPHHPTPRTRHASS